MSLEARIKELLDVVGPDVKALNTMFADPSNMGLIRIEREFQTRQDVNQHEVLRRVSDAPAALVETWANTAAWTGAGTVGTNRVWGAAAGLLRAAPTSARWVMRGTFKAPGTAGKNSYMGIQLVDGSVLALGQGGASTTIAINRTGNITAGMIVQPRAFVALPAGDYLITMTKDETCLSMILQQAGNSGQFVYGFRVLLADLPSAIANVYVSTNATDANANSWGAVTIYNELEVPPAAARNGLFTNTQPLVIWRKDTSGIGHYISIPGDNDPRVPAPLVAFCHQSVAASGSGGYAQWAEARWANVLSALNAAGYILVSSDNGPATTSGGTQDKFGNQAGLDDYVSLIKWARSHFSTAASFLLGTSAGGFFVYNLLHRRDLGGIAAAATISGGFDLAWGLTDATFRPLVLAAYGAADDADFATKTAKYDPNRQYPWRFRGTPLRLYSGLTDTLATQANSVDPVVNKLGPYAPEVGVVSVAGVGHLDAALYQGNDLVAFYEKYR